MRDIQSAATSELAKGSARKATNDPQKATYGAMRNRKKVVRRGRDRVLLANQLHPVGDGLQPAKFATDARRPEPVLNAARDFAFSQMKKSADTATNVTNMTAATRATIVTASRCDKPSDSSACNTGVSSSIPRFSASGRYCSMAVSHSRQGNDGADPIVLLGNGGPICGGVHGAGPILRDPATASTFRLRPPSIRCATRSSCGWRSLCSGCRSRSARSRSVFRRRAN